MPISAKKILTTLALLGILALYAWIQAQAFVPAYSEPDLDGYVWLAKRMAHFQPLHVQPGNLFQFQSHVWVENAAGYVAPKFAPGNSLIMAPFALISDAAMFLVSPLAGGLGILGAFLLFRCWMDRFPALIATLALSFNPLVIWYSGYLLAHALDMCFVTWAIYFLFRFLNQPTVPNAGGAGLTLGFTIAIRYPNALYAPLILVAFVAVALGHQSLATNDSTHGSTIRQNLARHRKALLALLAAYAVFPMALMLYNLVLFDAPLTTGYGLSNEQSAFTLHALQTHAPAFLEDGFLYVYFLTLPFGILGVIALGPWPARLIRLLWIFPIALLYAGYYWYVQHGTDFRFLLAITPALVGASFAVIDHLRAATVARYAALILLAGVQMGHGLSQIQHTGLANLHADQGSSHARMAQELQATIASDAFLFTTGRFAYGLTFRQSYTLYNLEAFHPAFALNFPDPNTPYTPRQQPQRLQRFQHFYATTSEAQLRSAEREIIEAALSSKRQVVFLLPGPTQRNWLDFPLTLLHSVYLTVPNEPSQRWGIYQVISNGAPSADPPATAPATSFPAMPSP